MGDIEHPIEFEICARSGQLPWECGLSACDNGCTTRTVEFVPLSTYRGAVKAERERIVGALREQAEVYPRESQFAHVGLGYLNAAEFIEALGRIEGQS